MSDVSLAGGCALFDCPPRLLVSVRDAREARTAVECGVDLIDIKEPRRGALGAATADTIAAIARDVGASRPLSVALGELVNLQPDLYRDVLHRAPIRFAKIGLAGAVAIPRWWQRWREAWAALPHHLIRVGVVYVDWQEADAPAPADALAVFADLRCGAVLFDTFVKDGRTLLDHGAAGELAEWIQRARMTSPLLVLAGSLGGESLDGLRAYPPDFIAVRGAACRGGRLGRISGRRLRHFAAAIQRAFPSTSPAHG
jgi:(5-formylfuran-3-yl)methyl phosphate synthase